MIRDIVKIMASVLIWGISLGAFAYDQPVVNLGYTSFFDGAPPAGPGLYFQNYTQFYAANRFNDARGQPLPLPRTKLDVLADIVQLIYLSPYRIGHANLGVSALLPWLVSAKVDDGLNHQVLKAHSGAGDLFIGPALQFDPILRADKSPLFVQRIEIDAMIPVGRYHRAFAINPGNHFWSINPYWASTLWFTPKWSMAVRLNYLWNAKNTTANRSFGPSITSTQAGQAIFGNLATEYALDERFHIGINGYFFNQFTDTRANGQRVLNRREDVWAIGPGLLLSLTKNQFLFFNLYVEHHAKNRPQGTNGIVRYVLHFS